MDKNKQIAQNVLPLVGGKDNVSQATHCMTRLRLFLKNESVANLDELKKIDGVKGCLKSGGQLQIVIGPNVSSVYEEFCKLADLEKKEAIQENLDAEQNGKKGAKGIVDAIFGYLSGSLSPVIPVLLAASLCKTVVAVFGPTLLGVLPETSDLYTLFTFMGDAGFYFLPIILAWSAARKLNVSIPIAMFLAAIMIHPTFTAMATEGTAFTVFGIPCSVQNYAQTVVPILLVVWIMSYVERFLKKYTPDALKVIMVPFLTTIVMTPLALCVLGPAGAFLGNYVCNAIIWLYGVAGPLAVAVIGALFLPLVCTGMHTVLYVYLFSTFPVMGYDSFFLPGTLASSWVLLGVAAACFLKFKKKENKSMVVSGTIAWLIGGVGEPLIYGLNLRYRNIMIASIAGGGIAGLVAGFMKLTAHVLNPSNGVYSLTAFFGGNTMNYVALAVTVLVAIAAGFILTMVLPLEEE